MITVDDDGTWVDPLVPISEGIEESRDLLVEIAGTVVNAAVIATVLAVVIGLVMLGFGVVLHRPAWSVRGVATLLGAAGGAIVVIGLSAWIAWFGGQAITIWH